MSEFSPDVVHAHSPWALGQAALSEGKRRGVATVLTVHLMRPNVVHHAWLASVAPGLAWQIVRRAYRDCGKHSDLVSSPSAVGRQHAMDLFGRRTIEIVSNGLTPLPSRPRVERSHGPLRLLYVGRLSKEKSVDVLIRSVAAPHLQDRVELRIVGSGTQARNLQRLALRLDAPVKMEGQLSDAELADLYSASDVFCMPSVAELECIAALEALSFDLPIVAPRGSALDEMQSWSGAVSLYDDACSAVDLARAITRMLEDPVYRSALQINAKAAGRLKSLASVADTWTDVYSRLRQQADPELLETPVASPETAFHVPVALPSGA